MQKLLPFALAATLLTATPAEAKVGDLLPRPQQVTVTGGTAFSLGRSVRLNDPTECEYLHRVLTEAGCTLSNEATATVNVTLVSEIPGAFNHRVNDFPDEAYSLSVSAETIDIKALTPTGVIRAAQTLQQLAEGYEDTPQIEALTLTDWPAFKVRGFMHDVGRSFLSFDELKKEIDLLARFKVNVFHWHLTEKLAWRFEVKAFPQLTAADNMTRYAGSYYTQEQCRELVDYAAGRGVTVIPEIDMPGHSAAFTTAMGFNMQTDEGVAALKVVIDEVADVFADAPYIHIGGDEVTITYPNFLKTMAAYVRSKGKKVVMWNRLVAGAPNAEQCDMTQMWATAGKVVEGLPNIDCRYNYTNHFDVYADLVGIYKSNIYYTPKGTDDVAGSISAAWNDTKTPTETDIIRQNNFYANVLATAERAWCGGGKQYIEVGGTTLPNAGEEFEEFADFERRFLFHKAHSLRNEPIAYVKQTNVKWRITEAFPNGGDKTLQLPPETATDAVLPTSYEYQGKTYTSKVATGAGIYLRHIWHPTVPSYYSSPSNNQTAYAWTYVYSPTEQDAAAQVEFYTYSRSGNETAPEAGQWDRRGSRLWLNDEEILPPTWQQPGASIPQDAGEAGLTNENLTAREPVSIHLKEGWNKVFMKLPHVNSGGTGRDKWQFTFVITDTDGRNALEGLIYSPSKTTDTASEEVATLLDEIDAYVAAHFGTAIGYLPIAMADALKAKASDVRQTLGESMTAEQRQQQANELADALARLREQAATADINQPTLSTDAEETWYTLHTPNRGSRYATDKGEGQDVIGEATPSKAAYWKCVSRTDGSFDIINAATGCYLSPASNYNTALKTTATQPDAGWAVKRSNEMGFVIIVSGNAQLNQTQANLSYKVYNWGNGTNTSDDGCKYVFTEVSLPSTPKLSTKEHAFWYQFCTPLRGNRYPTNKGIGEYLVGETTATDAATWKFVGRSDGTFNIVSYTDGAYVSPVANFNTALLTTATEPEAGWEFQPAATEGYFVLVSGTSQFNQTNNAGQGFRIFNWGNGTNKTDTGCQYAFTLVKEEDTPSGLTAPTLANSAPTLYDLSGRRVVKPRKGHIYLHKGGKFMAK